MSKDEVKESTMLWAKSAVGSPRLGEFEIFFEKRSGYNDFAIILGRFDPYYG